MGVGIAWAVGPARPLAARLDGPGFAVRLVQIDSNASTREPPALRCPQPARQRSRPMPVALRAGPNAKLPSTTLTATLLRACAGHRHDTWPALLLLLPSRSQSLCARPAERCRYPWCRPLPLCKATGRQQRPSGPQSRRSVSAHTHEEQGSLPVAALLQTLHITIAMYTHDNPVLKFHLAPLDHHLSRESRRTIVVVLTPPISAHSS